MDLLDGLLPAPARYRRPSPVLVAGRFFGIENTSAVVAGMIAPVITGYLVDTTGNYTAALLSLSGCVSLLGLIAWPRHRR